MREPGQGMRIARPFGIPVFISPYWFLIAGVFVVLYARGLDASVAANLRYVVAAAFVVLLYASVLVHELSHSLVALAFGLPVRRILLYPLGGFSEIEREPPTPGREFLVSAAGPLISLALAAGGFGLDHAFHPDWVPGVLLGQLVVANLLVGVFNLLPGLPLDGGRMLRAGVWKLTGRPSTATVAAAWAGRGLAGAVPASRCGPRGCGSGCPGCRHGCSPGGPSRSRPACRSPRRSGGRTPRRRAPW